MKNKKGFTLIELLVTIALMLSMLGMAIISFINVSNRKKEEAYNLIKEQIITAAEQYFDSNEYLFEGLDKNSIGIITVGKLVMEDYLNKVTDPRNGKSINYCNQVQVKKENGIYKSTYQETESTNCPDTINSVIVQEAGAPSVKVTLSGTSGNNGWYKSNVNLTAKVDTKNNGEIKSVERCEASGSTSCFNFSSLSEIKDKYEEEIKDTKEITIGYKVTNISGKSAMDWKTLKIDTKAPECSYKIDKQAASTGWYNNKTGIPKLTFNGTDELSGINGSSSYTPTIKTGNNNYTYTFKDNAGNESNKCTATLKYDNTNPTCSVTLNGDRKNTNQSYWYTSNVTLKGQCSDTLSGCNQGTVSNTFSNEGRYSNAVAGTIYDKAGNTNTCTYGTSFGIDKTPPVYDTYGAGRVHCRVNSDMKSNNSWGYSIKYHDALSGATAYLTEYYSSWDCGKTNAFHWAGSNASQYNGEASPQTFSVFAGCSNNTSPGARFKLVDGAGNVSNVLEVSADKSTINSSYSQVCNQHKWYTENR